MSLSTISVGSGLFLGARDVENPDNPNGTFVTADFAAVTLDPTLAHIISFDFDVIGFDAGDDVDYIVTIDGVPSPPVNLITGVNNGGTSDAGTEMFTVPAGATSVSLQLIVDQNGGSDYAGFDNFTVDEVPAMPVTLTAFTAEAATSGVTLAWDVATQRDNDFFAVEHSRNGTDFSEVTRVQGEGTTEVARSYSYTFRTDDAGAHYFRLRQMDYDGTANLSDVVLVELDVVAESLQVRNAGVAGYVQVTSATPGEIAIVSMTGEVVARHLMQSTSATLNISTLPRGIYLVTDGQVSRRIVR